MKRNRGYKEGDKVFAKVKGYPAWPAVVLRKSGKKYSVQFYGTNETGYVKTEEMSYYLKNKEEMVAGSKKKEFKDAIDEIEKAIAEAGGVDGDIGEAEEEPQPGKRKRAIKSDSGPSKKSKNSESDGESEGIDGPKPLNNLEKIDEGNASDEDVPFLPNVNLVSELSLKNWIIYADAVKESPELYKGRPVDQRHYYQHQVFPVQVQQTGKFVGVRLHKKWPLRFDNEYDCAMYDNDTASRVLLLKESVVTGEVTPESDPDSFVEDFEMTDAEIKRDAEMKLINTKYKRVDRLRNESTLVELDAKIKNCLGLNKADPKKALEFLETMLECKIDELMLKKHSHIVEMIRRLRKYIGNTEEWSLSAEELQIFKNDAEQIRNKADDIYKRFKTIVKLEPGATNFSDGFNEVVRKFKEDCIHLNNREVFMLCSEPFSRQAIIDRLEQEEELQEADIHRPTEGETEKTAEGTEQ